MGWAEIGLGPRARAKGSELRGNRGGAGSVVIDPARAKQKEQAVLRMFFGRGVWVAVLLLAGFVAMLVADVDRTLVLLVAPFAAVALGCTLVWLRRLAYWWRRSWRREERPQ